MPDEGVEVSLAVGLEAAFDGTQVVGMESFLALAIERHEDEIADHVGAGEIAAAGVHGLEDAVRVVLPLLEVEGDDAELAQSRAERRDVGAELPDAFLEEREGIQDTGRATGGDGPAVDEGEQRLRIARLEHQPVVMVALAEGVEEIFVPDLVGLEAVGRVVLHVPGEGFQDQGDGGEALLAVIDQVRRPVGVVRIDGGEADHGAEEMLAQVGALAGVEDVLPELSVFPPRPCVAALVDGHEELGCLPDEVEEEGFRGAHDGLRIGGTGYGPDPLGVVGPRPAEGASPLFAMCGKTCRQISAAR